jgi:predicted enzyme related to lactoylglutathione lyase
MNEIAYFEIQSSNPSRDIEFYKSVFGWNFIKAEGTPVEYYQIQTPGIRGGLLKRPAEVPATGHGTNAFVCSIEVTDFDKTTELILNAGGIVALPKFAVAGKCWQGYFLDRDNNTFGIFEVDKNAR